MVDTYWSIQLRYFHEGVLHDGNTLKNLLLYSSGELPESDGPSWGEVDYVYAPYLVTNNHWVALEIDLKEWVLNVYDCNHDLTKEEDLKVELNPVTVRLPVLLTLSPTTAVKYNDRYAKPLGFNRVVNIK